MTDISVTHPHNRDAKEVKGLIDKLACDLVKKHGGDYHWEDDVVHYKTLGVDACVDHDEENVTVNVKLGLLMKGLKNVLQKEIENYLHKLS